MKRDRSLPERIKDGCEFRSFLDRVADKWSLLIVLTLKNAPQRKMRFSELKRSTPGISQRMLTTTVRHLERDGLLVRRFFPEIPPRVEYELTSLGKDLITPISGLMGWIQLNWSAIKKARGEFDRKKLAR
jgi:DNA-binding HxlR family transcriptional regulator